MVMSLTGSTVTSEAGTQGPLRFHEPDMLATEGEDGSILLTCARPLEPLPASLLTWLQNWTAARPDHVVLAGRCGDGQWRRVTYSQAWSMVRSLGASLLRLGASLSRPVAILSE